MSHGALHHSRGQMPLDGHTAGDADGHPVGDADGHTVGDADAGSVRQVSSPRGQCLHTAARFHLGRWRRARISGSISAGSISATTVIISRTVSYFALRTVSARASLIGARMALAHLCVHTRTHVRTEGRADGRTDGRTDRRADGRTDGRMGGGTFVPGVIFLWIVLHTRSLFIAVFAVLHIGLSFPIAFFACA